MNNVKWETVLIEWVNCLKIGKIARNIADLRDGDFLANLQKLITKSSKPKHDVLTFIFNLLKKQYRNFTFENESEVHLSDLSNENLNAIISLLMHYTCIYDRRDVLTSPLCYDLGPKTQLIIRNFLEKISPSVTKAILEKIVLECIAGVDSKECSLWLGVEHSPLSTDSPLKDFLKTPISRVGRLQEKDRLIGQLKSDLEAERYEKIDLQEQIKRQIEINRKTEKQLQQKVSEITNLREEVMCLEQRTPPHYQDIGSRDVHKRLRLEIENLEQYIKQVENEQEEIRTDRDAAKEKLHRLEIQCKTWNEKLFESQQNLERTLNYSKQKDVECAHLQTHCNELSALLEEYKTKPLNDSSEFESLQAIRNAHEGEDLASSVVEVQLKDCQKHNSELTMQLRDMQSAYQKIEDDLHVLTSQYRNSEERCHILIEDNAVLIQRIKITEDKLIEGNKLLCDCKFDNQTLEKALWETQQHVVYLQNKLEAIEDQYAKESGDLKLNLTESRQIAENLQLSVQSNEDKMGRQSQKMSVLQQEIKENVDKFRAFQASSIETIAQMNSQITDREKIISDANALIAQKENEIVRLQRENDNMKMEVENSIQVSRESQTKLIEKEAVSSKTINDLYVLYENEKFKLEEKQAENRELQTDLKNMEDLSNELNEKFVDLHSQFNILQEQYNGVVVQLNDKERECMTIQEESKQNLTKINASQEVIDNLKEALSEVERQYEIQIGEFRSQLEYRQTEIAKLQDELTISDENCSKTVEQMNSKIFECNKTIMHLESELKLNKQKLEKNQKETDECKRCLVDSQKVIDDLQMKLKKTEENYTIKMNELNSSLEKEQMNLMNSRQQYNDICEKSKTLEISLSEVNFKLEEKTNHLHHVEKQYEKINLELQLKDATNNGAIKMNENLQEELARLQFQLNETHSNYDMQLTEHKSELELKDKENEMLQNSFKEMQLCSENKIKLLTIKHNEIENDYRNVKYSLEKKISESENEMISINDNLKTEIGILKKQYDNLLQENDIRLKILKKDNETLLLKINSIQDEYNKNYLVLLEKQKQIADLNEEKLQLIEENEMKSNKCKDLDEQLLSINNECQSHSLQLKDKEIELSTIKNENEKVQAELLELKMSLNKQDNHFTQLLDEKSNIITELNKNIVENNELKKLLIDAGNKYKSLQNESEKEQKTVKQHCLEVISLLEKKEAELLEAQKRHKEINSKFEEVQVLSSKVVHEMETQLGKKDENYELLQCEFHIIKEENAGLNVKISELVNMQDNNEHVQKAMSEALKSNETSYTTLNLEAGELEVRLKTLQEHCNEISSILEEKEKQLADSEMECDTKTQESQKQQQGFLVKVEALENENARLKAIISDLQSANGRLSEQNGKIVETVEDYEITISGLKKVVDSNLQTITDLRNDNNEQQHELETLTSDLLETKNNRDETFISLSQILSKNNIIIDDQTERSFLKKIEDVIDSSYVDNQINYVLKENLEKLYVLIFGKCGENIIEKSVETSNLITGKIEEILDNNRKYLKKIDELEKINHSLIRRIDEFENEKIALVKEDTKQKLEKENVLTNSNKMNCCEKMRDDEIKKKNMKLKQKLVLTENAKQNLEKVVKQLREENKRLNEKGDDSQYTTLLNEYHQSKDSYDAFLQSYQDKYDALQREFNDFKEQCESDSRCEDVKKLRQDLHNVRNAYSNLMEVKMKFELENTSLRKLVEDLNNQIGGLDNIKEAYEKLLEDNNRLMTLLDTMDFKRKRDKEEFIRLLKKEREDGEHRETNKVQEVRAEYERKLEKMKDKMLKLYREEVNKEAQKFKTAQSDNEMLAQTIADLRSELFEANNKIQMLEIEQDVFNVHCQNKNVKVLHQNHLMPKKPSMLPEKRKVSTLPRASDVGEELVYSRRASISSVGRNLHMEDEDDDFNTKYLADLKAGRCTTAPSAERDPLASRISELAWRNSLVLPHLKSSYPAETQFVSSKDYRDDDIRMGQVDFENSMCKLLPKEPVRIKKDFGTTSYKKPGPPTPSKNGSRLSIQNNEVHPLKEQNDNKTPKRLTPSRLKALFMGRQDKSARDNTDSTTPSSKTKRLNIFRKPK